jgi:TPR repeat protein
MSKSLAAALLVLCSAPAFAGGAALKEGRAAYGRKDYARAAEFFQKAADEGDAAGMDALGLTYVKGQGVAKDPAAAVAWFKKSAALGDGGGLTDLGYSYERGLGVTRDYREALKYYVEGARHGNRAALNNLGSMFERGSGGLVQDYVEAYKWYILSSARGGSAHTAANIKRLADKMTKEQVAEAQKRATAFYAAVAGAGRASAPRSDVDKPKYSLPPVPDDFAVVIGIEKYAGLPPATYAERDALAVRDHLLALGYPARNVMLLTGAMATKGALSAALNSWLKNRATAKSTVFFYYSGHGAPDVSSKEAYLVPVDGQPEDLVDTALTVKEVYAKLDGLKAKRVIVALDSCFSGAGGRSVLPKGARPLVTQVDAGARYLGKVISLSASGGEQISGALDEQGHGAFTYYLLRGLNDGAGAAKAPTVKSLYEFLKPKVEDAARLQNRDQTPQLAAAGSADVSLR